MNEAIEHQHDWRISPNRYYRQGPKGEKQYLLRCPTCPATGWGAENQEVADWPRWIGQVSDIEMLQS